MLRSRLKRFLVMLAVGITVAGCGKDTTAPEETTPETPTPETPAPPPTPRTESDLYLAAARLAWKYIENATQSSTGLAKATYTFQYATAWDIASQIGGTYSAHELGIIDDANYDGRIKKILSTLQSVALFDNAGFNRFYDTETGRMVRRDFTLSSTGFGWSTTDIGRLLIWLKILAVKQPQYAAQAQAIVNRLNYSKLINNGTLMGTDVAANGVRSTYQETGLGYEQYAAAGFTLWNHRPSSSMDATSHATQVDVLGVKVYIDTRGEARTTSEPYVMMGMETGWYNAALADQAQRVLAAQQARYDQRKILTMVTEDALPDTPPYFFYYYSVYRAGKGSFAVEGPDKGTFVDQPRWVSSKATFAWRALVPTPYTLVALNAVQSAAIPGQGWGGGVLESNLQPTGGASLNTAGVILEAALYQKSGHSFLSQPIS
ncbi:MAG: DUF3131 domain-containing protein [Gemmatimonadaceae bacterium]